MSMKRYLALRPNTTGRCFSNTTLALRVKHEGHDVNSRAPQLEEGDDFSKHNTDWLSDGMEVGLDETTGLTQDLEAGLSSEYSRSTDPFAVFDAPNSVPTNAGDFLQQMELFDNGGRIPVKQKWPWPISRPEDDGIASGGWDSGKHSEGAHKPREKIPAHLNEKYRYLTKRDIEVYAREAPLLEAMRERGRKLQREWVSKQPPAEPKALPPPLPGAETPSLPEPPHTPLTSLPTPRQLERLPQSPLFSPIPSFWSEKAYKPKPAAAVPEDRTPFQRKLHRNPYALTLASPVRRCLATKIRIPRDFLTSFEPMTNPADGRLWYLPRDLSIPVSKDELRVLVRKRASENATLDTEPDATAETEVEYETGTNYRQRAGNRYYILSSHLLMNNITSKNPSRSLAPPIVDVTRTQPRRPYYGCWSIMNHLNKIPGQRPSEGEWRADMDDFILKMMRKRAVGLVWKNLFAKKGLVDYRADWETIVKQKQMGCVLWLGREELLPTAPRDDSEEARREFEMVVRRETEWGPEPYTKISNEPFWSQKIPVLNALRLLGPEGVEEIRSRGPPVDVKRYVVVKDKPDTVELRRWLLKIESYMAQFESPSEDAGLGEWEPRDDQDDAGEDVEFETVYVPADER